MIKQIEKVLDVMKADYRKRSIRSADAIIMTKMGAEYDDGLEIKEGIRYYKIICNNDHQRRVAGFVVKAGHVKFKEGDLLVDRGLWMVAETSSMKNLLKWVVFVGQE